MPAGPRVPARPAAGPGRGKSRSRRRSVADRPDPAATPAPTPPPETATPVSAPGRRWWRGRTDFTARAIALAVVLLVLVISYATSLRIYVAQTRGIAETQATITERQARIAALEDELAAWEDDGYVRTQARERLGWVVPGETGFTVVDADGKPVGGGADITEEVVRAAAPPTAWWTKLWGSVEAADRRAPTPAPPARPRVPQPPITEDTEPRSSGSR